MAIVHLWEDAEFIRPEIIARAKDLTESIVLIEKDGSEVRGLMKIRGVFQRYDCINANGRKYEKSLWERVLKDERVMGNIANGSMHGLVEHPEDGKTKLDRGVAMIVNKIWDAGNGNIMGEATIPATHVGKDIAAIIDAGGSIGVSSRGDGEVETIAEGYQRVKPETYTLITWDIVADNSVPGARPIRVAESVKLEPSKQTNITEQSTKTNSEIKQDTTMNKLGEMRKLDLALQSLKPPKGAYAKMGLNTKAGIYESALELSGSIAALIASDATLKSYGEKLLKEARMIEDEMDGAPAKPSPVPSDDAPPAPAGEGAPPVDEDITQETFSKILAKVLKDLCPECDDLKVNEAAAGIYNKFVEGEPLGILATVDMLRETADKGAEGAPPAPGADGAPSAPPAEEGEPLQFESALSIINALSKSTPSAKLAEAEKAVKAMEAKIVEADKNKERLAKNLQLLKESADYIEKVDAELAETKAILDAAVKLLKEHKIDDASILVLIEKKGDKGETEDKAMKDAKKDADTKSDKEKKDKKDEKGEEAKADKDAKKAEDEDKAVKDAKKKAESTEDSEKAKKEAEDKVKLTEVKAKEEFTKMNDGKKTVKEIEETMNSMFPDVDWKGMVNFKEASEALQKKLAEAAEPHEFVRQMGRLREGAFRQLNSTRTSLNETKK